MKVLQGYWLAVALPIVAAGAFITSQRVTIPQPRASHPSAAADRVLVADTGMQQAARDQGDEREPIDAPNGFVDLYGNDVTDAIATYTFDQAGSLYELHSPQTELPRLGIPKS